MKGIYMLIVLAFVLSFAGCQTAPARPGNPDNLSGIRGVDVKVVGDLPKPGEIIEVVQSIPIETSGPLAIVVVWRHELNARELFVVTTYGYRFTGLITDTNDHISYVVVRDSETGIGLRQLGERIAPSESSNLASQNRFNKPGPMQLCMGLFLYMKVD